jgi:isohexenylglutaconyl-CoA hydratase
METKSMQTLVIEDHHPVIKVTLSRPKQANAMNRQMVDELMSVMDKAEREQYRVLVLNGANGNFCAGGDIRDMLANASDHASIKAFNREFGRMIARANALPLVVIAALQGAVLGGGLGLACVSDIAIADNSCHFGMPETGLGITPAQIAPFVVQRIGLTQARRIALLGHRFDSHDALQLGLIHQKVDTHSNLDAAVAAAITAALRCAPNANALTKSLLLRAGTDAIDTLLDDAAHGFADTVCGSEGSEGARAFVEKRTPAWARVHD